MLPPYFPPVSRQTAQLINRQVYYMFLTLSAAPAQVIPSPQLAQRPSSIPCPQPAFTFPGSLYAFLECTLLVIAVHIQFITILLYPNIFKMQALISKTTVSIHYKHPACSRPGLWPPASLLPFRPCPGLHNGPCGLPETGTSNPDCPPAARRRPQ